ncbi:hypothetical protein PNH38_09855 [Anoxybacillus rupiensis]|jgi:hypothetical protein|uniref:Zinc ribbon domain-containing protein n=1 Tax=Anoxybacteroides rupiense TaxID=311460 RepID=A0ABD5IV29_9BACL|nr:MULTISPECIES: hypothetical protein [Anoxybacillus]KXG10050.1 hypothetical protein AT864_01611 [Anoxybacillus sp. P3H1B]MBB3907620.1 hypothetical protein [Anoxybacillus rupiensis]MBS2771716.1 hypothetical protein [Anoxybacillus rupiensis]MDE8564193.1 hypothetical protein [Anoxybacillus rupiensis]MED5052173.1 hypothetical protein [Anoxybacillus rupiensis]
MNICPLCNGLRERIFFCSHCGTDLEDHGKITDYFDDYSPYMEIDTMKKVDGYPMTLKHHECVHLFYCPQCRIEEVRFIKE